MRCAINILSLVVALAATGCGSGIGSSGASNTNGGSAFGGTVPPVTDPTTPISSITGGASVPYTPASTTALNAFYGYTLNTPTNFKITINLQKMGTYAKSVSGGTDVGLGGTVTISFTDDCPIGYSAAGTSQCNYNDSFSSLVNSAGTIHNDSDNHRYNLLTTDYPELGGSLGYHGFFEDVRGRSNTTFPVYGGSIILVVDSMNDLGDGQGPKSANGSIYFLNYFGYAPVSPTNCWFVSGGWPYDCRSWKSGNGVNTKKSIYPDNVVSPPTGTWITNGYVKLGTFTNVDLSQAISGL